MLSVLIHTVIFFVQSWALVWDLLYLKDTDGNRLLYYREFPGKFKYLTFWCQLLQTFYFGLCLLNDIFGTNIGPRGDKTKRSILQKTRDFLLSSIIFPIGSFVVLTFWGIYAIDRELVFPKALDKIIPQWLNHVMHTTVILFLLLDKFFVYHQYPSRGTGLKYCLGFAAIYQVWILYIAYSANIWVYPILQVLDNTKRVAFFAALWVVLSVLYISGEKFTQFVWGSPTRTGSKKMK